MVSWISVIAGVSDGVRAIDNDVHSNVPLEKRYQQLPNKYQYSQTAMLACPYKGAADVSKSDAC